MALTSGALREISREINREINRQERRAPVAHERLVPRSRLDARLAETVSPGGPTVALLVSPPGFGKSVCVRQWLEQADVPSAWVSVDLLDRDPTSFWAHLITSLRQLVPSLDHESSLVLAERGGLDPSFLGVLVEQLERAFSDPELDAPVAVVVDDVTSVLDPSVFAGLALLVERVGQHVRLILTGRSDPPLPLAAWRSAGRLVEVREAELRFSDDEALAMAGRVADPSIGAATIRALNERVAGWPIGLHLTLMASSGATDPEGAARRFVDSDRLLSDYVASEVLGSLPDDHADVVLALSVLELIDDEMCRELVGTDAARLATDLARRGVLLTRVDDRPGALRFHSLVRELLERELRHRDPVRWRDLHRAAARSWAERGDLNSAYRHLIAIGDNDGANALVVTPVFEMVNRGDHDGLAAMLAGLPPDLVVTHPSLALDLSVAWFFAGRRDEMSAWCDRAESLSGKVGAMSAAGGTEPSIRQRIHTMRAGAALMDGELDVADEHVTAHVELEHEAPADDQIGRRFATIAMRLMLESGRLDDAASWADRLPLLRDPPVVVHVTTPALMAWYQLELGNLASATRIAGAAVAWAEEHGARPHHGSLDALVVGTRCRLGAGDLLGAWELVESARADAETLRYRWNLVRTTLLAAEIRRLSAGPAPAIEMIRDLRVRVGRRLGGHLAHLVDTAEATVLLHAGRHAPALRLLEQVPDGPRRRLLLVRAAVATGPADPIALEALLGDWSGWPMPLRLEAAVSTIVGERDDVAETEMAAALSTAAATGWVSPFLGHGPEIERILDRLPLERLHRELARVRAGRRQPMVATLPEPLTERELSILALLPTHLSYAQIGRQLYLSVNTVKTNLKAVYRKLGVGSRAEAVDAARRHALL